MTARETSLRRLGSGKEMAWTFRGSTICMDGKGAGDRPGEVILSPASSGALRFIRMRGDKQGKKSHPSCGTRLPFRQDQLPTPRHRLSKNPVVNLCLCLRTWPLPVQVTSQELWKSPNTASIARQDFHLVFKYNHDHKVQTNSFRISLHISKIVLVNI